MTRFRHAPSTAFNRFPSSSPIPDFRSQLADSYGDLLTRAQRKGIHGPIGIWSPRMDMSETRSEYRIRIDLPGMTKDDVTLRARDHHLTVQGHRKPTAAEEGERFLHTERARGGFFRRIPLPESANVEAATATFQNGILTIRIPKTDGHASKKIAIS